MTETWFSKSFITWSRNRAGQFRHTRQRNTHQPAHGQFRGSSEILLQAAADIQVAVKAVSGKVEDIYYAFGSDDVIIILGAREGMGQGKGGRCNDADPKLPAFSHTKTSAHPLCFLTGDV
jgi:hypothetical protein